MVAHLHFLPTHKPTLKNAKELPSQRTTTAVNNGQQSKDRKNASTKQRFGKSGGSVLRKTVFRKFEVCASY